MSEAPVESGQINDQPINDGGAPVAEPSINPAWNPLLEKLPSSLHGIVTPTLKEWDSNYQQSLQKVHSEYEPWKPLIEQQLDPADLYQSYQISQALEQDPQRFIEAVMEHYGIQLPQQGQQPEQLDDGEEDPGIYDVSQDPEFQRTRAMTEQMAKLLIAQQQQQQEAEEDEALDADLQAAREKLGEFDEDYVLQRVMYYEEDVPTAVQAYQAHVNSILSQHRNPGASAPIIMGSGGGTPSQPTAVSNLSPQDRRALIAQTLANAAANGG